MNNGNLIYIHHNKMWIKHLKWYYLKLSVHSESWYWFSSSVFYAEVDNLNISSQL
jgi:hypothetical protein